MQQTWVHDAKSYLQHLTYKPLQHQIELVAGHGNLQGC